MAEAERRKRRTPEEARAHILEIAEMRLAKHGPDGLKVADVAKDAGIAHSTLLHHFGSTADLQRSLVDQMVQRLLNDILEQLSTEKLNEETDRSILERTFEVLADRGHARLLAWLTLTGQREAAGEGVADRLLQNVVDTIIAQAEAHGGTLSAEDRQKAKFSVYLAAISAIGDGLSGPVLAPLIGLTDKEARQDFRHWMAGLLSQQILDDGEDC